MKGYDGKQTGRKIKSSKLITLKNIRTNSYNLAMNTGIGTHFTNRIQGLAKKINHSLLEKVRCVLSNARLDKSFWAEAIVYASHLINGL